MAKTSVEHRPILISGLAILTVLFLPFVAASDPPCQPYSPSQGDSQIPKINGSFVAFLEWWERGTQTITYREEYVDQDMNIAAVRIYGHYDPGDVYTYISDYNSSQLFIIGETSAGKTCQVSNIDPIETYTFEYTMINNIEHIAITPVLLNYGTNAYFKPMGGPKTVRDKACNRWQACMKDDTHNETVVVDFFFTEDGWTTSSSSQPVPLVSNVARYIKSGSPSEANYEIQVRTDFVFFQNYIKDRSIFELPTGILCNGRKPSKPVPQIPSHFRFRSERIITTLNEVGEYDEWYNQADKIVRIDSKPMPGDQVVMDSSIHTQILDFRMGISYLIFQDTGTCIVTPITPEEFNVKMVDENHVAMKSPQELFHFESGNFVYTGRTSIRGISTDVWTGQRGNFPLGAAFNSTWNWYFSTDEWALTQFGEPLKNVPVLLTIDIPEKSLHYIYNIYDFSPKDPDLVDFDVSACYLQNDLRHLQFSLIGNTQIASKEPTTLRYQLTQQLKSIMDVSILRISNLQVDFYQGGLHAQFSLLDPPDFVGDVAGDQNPKSQTSSEKAVQNLANFLHQGTVFLHFKTQNAPTTMVSDFVSSPSSLQEVVQFLNGTSKTMISPASSHTTSPTQSSGQTSSHRATLPGVSISQTPPGCPTCSPARFDSSTTGCHIDVQRPVSESTWTSAKVAGLSVGVLCCGFVVGVLAAVLSQHLSCIRNTRRKDGTEQGTLSYAMM